MKSIKERFLSHVNKDDINGCWNWIGAKSKDGYGRFWFRDKLWLAHRASYEIFIGKIPHGMQLDHLCRNRSCINPKHLEAVTQQENIRRGEAGKHLSIRTHCSHGHLFDNDNTYIVPRGDRICRKCQRQRFEKYQERHTAQ